MAAIANNYIAYHVNTSIARKPVLLSDVRFEGDINLPSGISLGTDDLYLGINADVLTPNAEIGDPGNCIEVSGGNTTPSGVVRKQYTAVNDAFTFNVSPGTGRLSPITIKVISPTPSSSFTSAVPWPHIFVRVVLNNGGNGGHPANQQSQKVGVHWPVKGYGINTPVYFSGVMTSHNNYRNGSANDLYSARYAPSYEDNLFNSGWDLTGTQQVTTTSGDLRSVPFNGFPGFGDFTIGFGDPFGGDPVPVELTSFSARYIDGSVRLNWNTATELNNFGFAIERSQDSKNWEEVGFVQGYGTSSSPKSYSHTDVLTDDLARTPQLAYRLRQMDRDGTIDYSNIVFVKTGELPAGVELYAAYPNPFNPATTISFTVKESANVNLKVYNTFGQVVATLLSNSSMDAGLHTMSFNGNDLPSGVYMAVLEASGELQQQKLVLNK
ncbi:MAG: T9SS type A sorting domain-containing protein [Bacteroidota bacterium]